MKRREEKWIQKVKKSAILTIKHNVKLCTRLQYYCGPLIDISHEIEELQLERMRNEENENEGGKKESRKGSDES